MGVETSPEATARRIVGFATGFLDAFRGNHPWNPPEVQIERFVSLIRGAIEEGFLKAQEFLEGITKLSEIIDENINRTFELTNQYLDEFHRTQVDLIQNASEQGAGEVTPETDAQAEEAE